MAMDLTPGLLRCMTGLYPVVRRIPSPLPDTEALYTVLCDRFPDPSSRDYIAALTRSTAAPIRLFSLSLLPPLLDAAGLTSNNLSLHRSESGRPTLRPLSTVNSPPIDFNLTHSASHAACFLWLGGGFVGVDIEEPIPAERAKRLANRFLSDGERACLQGDDISSAFTRIWTQREALCKQDGGGQPLRFDSSAPHPSVYLASFRLPDTGAYLSVCLPYESMNLSKLSIDQKRLHGHTT